MSRHTNENQLLFALKKVMKTQRAAAKAVNCSEELFFYYMNTAKKVPTEVLIRIKVLLLKHHEKVPELSNKDLSIAGVEAPLLPISMQAEWAKILMKQPVKRSEQTLVSADEKKFIKCKNFYTSKERRAKKMAKQAGFENHTTMYQAIKVIDKGCPELIAAMDKGMVKISVAAKLAALSEELQRQLVNQGVDAIKAYFKAQKVKQSLKKLTTFEGLKNIEAQEQLKALEIHHQLPLRKTLIGLSAQCDRKGQFIWDLAHLKTCLLLEEVPLEAAVDVLCQHQMIEKKTVSKKYVGQILL